MSSPTPLPAGTESVICEWWWVHASQMMDSLQTDIDKGGIVIDFHGSDLFPVEWFDLVLVLRCSNTILYDRLASRGYSERKLSENITAEIMGVSEEEAREAFPPEAVHVIQSEVAEELDSAVERAAEWELSWRATH